MNLDELRSVQSKERKKDSLQNLRPSFYQEVGEYIADLERERDRVAERAEDPFSSPEVSRLTDEIETAKDVVEAIYERRMGKLVKQASLAAAGMSADDEGLTAEEADLFDDLVDRIGSNKTRVLDVLEGVENDASGDTETPPTASGTAAPDTRSDRPADADRTASPDPDPAATADSPPDPPQEPPAGTEPEQITDPESAGSGRPDASGVTPADVMGGGAPATESESDEDTPADADRSPDGRNDAGEGDADSSASPQPRSGGPAASSDADADAGEREPSESDAEVATDSEADVDRVTVKITRDIGPILGVDDREYTLSTDDIVTLPEQNAAPLVDREAAEPLE